MPTFFRTYARIARFGESVEIVTVATAHVTASAPVARPPHVSVDPTA